MKRRWQIGRQVADRSTVFHIGNPMLSFQRTASQRFECAAAGLEVCAKMERRGEARVISHLLRNQRDKRSPPFSELAPPFLRLERPSADWVFLHAHGGTTEYYCPPLAYETRESFDVTCLEIESAEGGRSSNKDLPFLIAVNQRLGEGFFCGLEWSGHWNMRVLREKDDALTLMAGVKVNQMTLAPREELPLPAAHIGWFRGGLEDGTNALRRYLMKHVCPSHLGSVASPRVSYDHWFGVGNDFDEPLMRAQVDRAAELGVEVFVHDAAWFAGGFPDGVGNWDTVDSSKWPRGLEPLAEYVRAKGMQFGLWFEIERSHAAANAYRRHPDLFFPPPASRPKASAHLNLARRDAQDWAIEIVGGWIKRLDLRWSRWDYNIDPQPYWETADPTGKIQFAYMRGLYRVLDTLMKEHPAWMIEACASGGRRIDFGTLRRAHTIWFSDETVHPFNCRVMQARANRFLPGHLLNSSVAVSRGQGDKGLDETAILSRMLGKLAFDGDVASWSAAFTGRASALVARFKQVRHLFVQDYYQLLPFPVSRADWLAVQFVAYDASEAVVFVFAGSAAGRRTLPLKGLNSRGTYRVTSLDGSSTCVAGKMLLQAGLRVSLGPDAAGLWQIEAMPRSRDQARGNRSKRTQPACC